MINSSNRSIKDLVPGIVNYPIVFHRDFRHDLPRLVTRNQETTLAKCQRVALAVLPLIALHPSCSAPLSVGMSGIRTLTHGAAMVRSFMQGDYLKGSISTLHTLLSTASVGLFFLNPALSYVSSSISDLLLNTESFVGHVKAGNKKEAAESLLYITLDLLFLTSICYGSIEITVACMLLQTTLNFYQSYGHFKQGHYIESLCSIVLGGTHLYKSIPQVKLLKWKYEHGPNLVAELKQDKNGFVYLDIPDEDLYSLYELYKTETSKLPPYFGKGRAGAHVSVIDANTIKRMGGLKIQDVGKKFTFRIVHTDIVYPSPTKAVHIISLSSPELEALRMRHGLSPKLNDHDFHMTYAIG